MPTAGQPANRRGTVGHPYSALNLRLVLATFGFITCAVLAVVLFRFDMAVLGWLVLGLGAVAVVDLVIIQRRRRARRRADRRRHSLFE